MGSRRLVVLSTACGIAVLAVALIVLQWGDASKVATAVSALADVAAVGVAVWTALPSRSARSGSAVRLSRTGRAVAGPGGQANSGISGPAGSLRGDVYVDRTGEADTSDGGNANSGIELS